METFYCVPSLTPNPVQHHSWGGGGEGVGRPRGLCSSWEGSCLTVVGGWWYLRSLLGSTGRAGGLCSPGCRT